MKNKLKLDLAEKIIKATECYYNKKKEEGYSHILQHDHEYEVYKAIREYFLAVRHKEGIEKC